MDGGFQPVGETRPTYHNEFQNSSSSTSNLRSNEARSRPQFTKLLFVWSIAGEVTGCRIETTDAETIEKQNSRLSAA